MEVSSAYIEHIYQLNYPALVGQLLSPSIQPEERDVVLRRLLEMNQVFLQQKSDRHKKYSRPSRTEINMGDLANDIFSEDVIEQPVAPPARVYDRTYEVPHPSRPAIGFDPSRAVGGQPSVAKEKVTSAMDRILELSSKISSRKS